MSNWRKLHGFLGDSQWEDPACVGGSDAANRPDQGNSTPSLEYLDCDDVLDKKLDIVAGLLRRSTCTVAYTGAGLSRASGISDYASDKGKSIIKAPKIRSALDAEPTFAHHVLAELERQGLLHHYVQQNHDGLPQKAGFPQEKMNEIHGAWFDPSNQVVQFSESLRSDYFAWLLEMEQKAELCLCLGTSLSGMNADRTATTPAEKALNGDALGTVIINIQQTPLDASCSVRVWCTLDEAFRILARKLSVEVVPRAPEELQGAVFSVPYNAEGVKDARCSLTLDLREGSPIRIAPPEAMNAGTLGVMGSRDGRGNFRVMLEGEHKCRLLGSWWVSAALRGALARLPLVNTDARVEKAEDTNEDEDEVDVEAAAAGVALGGAWAPEIQQLVRMGFREAEARDIISVVDGDVSAAAMLLFEGQERAAEEAAYAL